MIVRERIKNFYHSLQTTQTSSLSVLRARMILVMSSQEFEEEEEQEEPEEREPQEEQEEEVEVGQVEQEQERGQGEREVDGNKQAFLKFKEVLETNARRKLEKKKDKPTPPPRKTKGSYLRYAGKHGRSKGAKRTGTTKPSTNVWFRQKPLATFPTTVSAGVAREPLPPSDGMVKAALSTIPFGELRNIISFLLITGAIEHPENFIGYTDFRANDGGKDMLFYEFMKEQPEVWRKAYELRGRLASGPSRTKEEMDFADLKEFDFAMGVPTHADYIQFQAPFYQIAPGDKDLLLMGNIGLEPNDKTVYVKHPSRVMDGRTDNHPDQVMDVCGDEMDRWTALTALEGELRPELDQYIYERELIGDARRLVCPPSKLTTDLIRQKSRTGVTPDTPNQPDEVTVAKLKGLSWTDSDIEEFFDLTDWLRLKQIREESKKVGETQVGGEVSAVWERAPPSLFDSIPPGKLVGVLPSQLGLL